MIDRESLKPLHPHTLPSLQVADLLAAPDSAFITLTYRALLGRDPDLEGRARYTWMEKKVGRFLVLAEIRSSMEGREHAGLFISEELDKIAQLYRVARLLPLGNKRWKVFTLLANLLVRPRNHRAFMSGNEASLEAGSFANPSLEQLADIDCISTIMGCPLEVPGPEAGGVTHEAQLLMLIEEVYSKRRK